MSRRLLFCCAARHNTDKRHRAEGEKYGKKISSRLPGCMIEWVENQRKPGTGYMKLKEKYSISDEEAEKYLKKYWEVV